MKTEISLHWTAGTYSPNYIELRDYHGGVPIVNQRGQYEKWNNYTDNTPHTWNRNGKSIGFAICGMQGASPFYFGPFAITKTQIESLCKAAAEVAFLKKISFRNIKTHAEWGLIDGYGPGQGDPQTRWDLAILEPLPRRAYSREEWRAITLETGRYLRRKIYWYYKQLETGEAHVGLQHRRNVYKGRCY